MNEKKRIILEHKEKGKYFLVQNYMKLSSTYNVLGFWGDDLQTWDEHVSTITLTEEEFNQFMLPLL